MSTTAGRVGVLVYVSLFEHRAVVLLDRGVKTLVPADFAKQLVDRAVAGLTGTPARTGKQALDRGVAAGRSA